MFSSRAAIYYITFLNLLVLCVSSDHFFEKRRVKRAGIDLQTCIEHFNVHKDKIIRTQDSQNMGAKYLNEIDLGSREECLRLCCETENCDVFVFEEKNSGSCYLFHCGPPEDFKCKFTHHVNYSSGVLSVNRQLVDLETEIKLTKHEQDLTKLRKPEAEPPEVIKPIPEIRTTPSTTTTTVVTKEVVPIVKNEKTPEDARKCSRFQFECRSTGECIAIYNACDGIPQCADGSDEAPELGCPDSLLTTMPPPPRPNNPPPPVRFESNIVQPQIPQLPPQINPQRMYGAPQLTHENPNRQLPPVGSHPESDFIRPVNDPRNMNPRMQYDPQQMMPYAPQMPLQPQQSNWLSHQVNQIQPQMPQYTDKNSHIFNHKESGLQVPDGQEISQPYVDGREYPKVSNYYPDNYRQPVQQQENWPADDGTYNHNLQYGQEAVPQDTRPKDTPLNYKAASSNNQPVETKTETAVNPKHEQDKMAHELKHSKDNMEHGTTSSENAKIKIEKHPSPVYVEQYPDVVAYKMSDSDLQDGIAQTPKGAVLSLTLGLIVTCLMAILIGCRLKMVRRRLRKGGKSYAHDADYLVNGMYL